MKKNHIIAPILFFLYILALILSLTFAFGQGSKAQSIVPITNLPLETHLLIFSVLWPNIASIVFIIIFPLIFVPLFIKIKNKIWFQYKNSYIDIPLELFNVKKFFLRAIFVFLLTMGLSATLISSGFIRVENFLTNEQKNYWVGEIGIDNPLYIQDIFNNIAFLVYPIAIGILAIGWAIEDAGLIHHKLPSENVRTLYKIEPLHLEYKNIISGYAGITAIVYYVSFISYYFLTRLQDVSAIMGILIVTPLLLIFTMTPAYFIYSLITKKYLVKRFRKGIKEARVITEDELNIN